MYESENVYFISDMVENSKKKEKVFIVCTFLLRRTSAACILPG